jgi:hypothetical protein
MFILLQKNIADLLLVAKFLQNIFFLGAPARKLAVGLSAATPQAFAM